MNKFKISICIPTFNRSKLLEKAIKSVLSQLDQKTEVIILDDASKDDTQSVVSKYTCNNKCIKYYRNKINMGIFGNFNKCLELAKGEWIKFLNDDDALSSGAVDLLLRVVRYKDIINNNVGLIVGTSKKGRTNFPVNKVLYGEDVLNFLLIYSNQIGCPSNVVIKKSVVDKHNLKFNENKSWAEDYIFFINVLKHSNMFVVDHPLAYVYEHEESATSRLMKNNVEIAIEEDIEAVKYLGSILDIESNNINFFLDYHKKRIARYYSVVFNKVKSFAILKDLRLKKTNSYAFITNFLFLTLAGKILRKVQLLGYSLMDRNVLHYGYLPMYLYWKKRGYE